MNRFLSGLTRDMEKLKGELNAATTTDLKIIARRLALFELNLQACRSLFEARLMEDEIDSWEADRIKDFSK
jgi:hypothetical protein